MNTSTTHYSKLNRKAIFSLNSEDEFIVNVTNDEEEIKKSLSVGFEYACQKDDLLHFRKRK